MKRRVVRDLGTIVGVVVILAVVVAINVSMRLQGLQKKFDNLRREYETQAVEKGHQLLDWELLRETKGSIRSGAKYDGQITAQDGQVVNLMGFMTPIDQFRAATHFMLLPLPIQCYFCQAPPLRDVMLVRLAEGEAVDLVEEPVMITGKLVLNKDGSQKFFYTIENATRTAEGKTTVKNYGEQHRTEGRTLGKDLLTPDHAGQQPDLPKEQLLPPAEAPGMSQPPPPPAP